MNCLQIINAQLGYWAKTHLGPKAYEYRGRHYVGDVNDNFWGGLDEMTEAEFRAGDGGELEGKARALHSSSVLAVNFCQHWRRTSQVSALAQALGTDRTACRLAFESKHSTGVGRQANLDLELHGGKAPVGVEAKFCEPFGAPKKREFFRPAYFETETVWSCLTKCRRLAGQIQEGKRLFLHLDAAQLLKHSLALSRSYPNGFDLILLWYRPATNGHQEAAAQASKMENEIEEFGSLVEGEINFRAVTYQALFEKLRASSMASADYCSYLQNRYLGAN